ncbi:DUF4012 domain-containing protein [Microbacterium sp. NPDC078428]|uniref:DUF4012 domain-containing protein n=1 Tax=Microbacterium sp. NPDC078428 TaxID=3364190 RepID=UPI0037CC0B53
MVTHRRSTATTDARSTRRSRRALWITLAVVVVVVLLLAAAAWLAFRALAARDALAATADEAALLQQSVLAGEHDDLDARARSISAHASDAARATGDPVWRAAEILPWVGANLRAVRDISEIADELARDGVPALLDAADAVDLDSLGVTGNTVDLAPLDAARPALESADGVFSAAAERAAAIDTGWTLPIITDAVDEVRQTLEPAASTVDGLARAASLLPSMLGADGPRDYLLLMQNNAEVRSSGGIPGAFAVLHAEDGAISLTGQASTADFRKFDEPIAELDAATVALFDDQPGQYVQHALQIPDFPKAAALAAEFWAQTMGSRVDGVVAVDTVTIADLLRATGPVSAGEYELTPDDAVDILLSRVYADEPSPIQLDAFFAGASSAVFEAVTDGRASPAALVEALAAAGDDGRIRMWSADPSEQERLAETTLAGALPLDGAEEVFAGVFFNDSTGGKMNYYTAADITGTFASCGDESRVSVDVVWANTLDPARAESLPHYVTGNGSSKVDPGQVRTRIAVYGPQGWTASGSTLDGAAAPGQATIDQDRPVIQYEMTLSPGESTTVSVDFAGAADEAQLGLVSTPLLRDPNVRVTTTGCE